MYVSPSPAHMGLFPFSLSLPLSLSSHCERQQEGGEGATSDSIARRPRSCIRWLRHLPSRGTLLIRLSVFPVSHSFTSSRVPVHSLRSPIRVVFRAHTYFRPRLGCASLGLPRRAQGLTSNYRRVWRKVPFFSFFFSCSRVPGEPGPPWSPSIGASAARRWVLLDPYIFRSYG